MKVILLGYNSEKIVSIMSDPNCEKLSIFDESDHFRPYFEKLHSIYGDRVTFYEGDIECNIYAFLKRRTDESFVIKR